MAAIDGGAEDVFEESETGETVVHTAPGELAKVRDTLSQASQEVTDAELSYVPQNALEVSDKETARKVMNLMDALEDIDEVTATHTNFDIAESIEM